MKKMNVTASIHSLSGFLLFLFMTLNALGQALPPKEFKDKLQKQNGVLLDVRTPEEYTGEHISGAINMDVRSDGFKSRMDSLDKSRTYFMYCKSGRRSEEALNLMKEAGFKNLFHLQGGIEEWKLDGNKVMREK